jgi:hypothetical protein
LKASAKKKIYGTITVISTVLAVIGGTIGVYGFFAGQAEEERKRQEEAKKSEADKLREQIAYGKSILPDCNYSDNVEMQFSSKLNRSERELILNDNFSGSKALYEGVRADITRCEPITAESPLISVSIFALVVLSLPAIFAIAFGSLWYRASKKQQQERTSK